MQRRKFLIGVAAAVVTARCGGSSPTGPTPPVTTPPYQPSGPIPPDSPPTPVLGLTQILAFGDSMTEGTTSTPLPFAPLTAGKPESYPYKLQQLTTARYTSQTIVVLNAGQAGEAATDGPTRQRFNDRLSEAGPQLLLLLEGANDMSKLAGQGNTAIDDGISLAVNAMEDMVRDARGRRIEVMLATLPPQRTGGAPARGEAAPFLGRYNDALKVMAGKKDARIVDLYALIPLSLVGEDGLHLTEAGYQRMAEVFLDAIAASFDVP